MTKEILESKIVGPLLKCVNEDIGPSEYETNYIISLLEACWEDKCQLYLMDRLSPLYLDYLYGKRFFGNVLVEHVMRKLCSWDIPLGAYLKKLNLIEMAIKWAENNTSVNIREFQWTLSQYYKANPEIRKSDIEQQLWQEISKLEVYGNRIKAGYLVVLHSYIRIDKSANYSNEIREHNNSLVLDYWDYLKLVYSVMIRCIVDCGHKDFAGVANNVRILPGCHPYIHIFYSALQLRFDDLCKSGTDSTKLARHLNKIKDINNVTTQNYEDLDELCKILFTEDFQDYLEKNRMPSYDEVLKELKEVNGKVDFLNNQVNQMAQKMVDAVKASIPVKDIENELLRLSPGTGYDVFTQVNSLLTGNPAWMERANDIKKKILDKRDNPIIQNNVYPQAGSTANIGCEMKQAEFKVLPNGAGEQQMALESNN